MDPRRLDEMEEGAMFWCDPVLRWVPVAFGKNCSDAVAVEAHPTV